MIFVGLETWRTILLMVAPTKPNKAELGMTADELRLSYATVVSSGVCWEMCHFHHQVSLDS